MGKERRPTWGWEVWLAVWAGAVISLIAILLYCLVLDIDTPDIKPRYEYIVKKKVRDLPVPSRDVTTKLSLGGNNNVITELFLPRGSLVSGIPAGDGKLVNLFLRCTVRQ
jgi:hypothetical protein